MKKSEILKNKMINDLIEDDINSIMTGECYDYLDTILREGFIGYTKQTLKELKTECKQRFEDERCEF